MPIDCGGVDKRGWLYEYCAKSINDPEIHEEIGKFEWIFKANFIFLKR